MFARRASLALFSFASLALAGCGGQPLMPQGATSHVLSGAWIGASTDHSLIMALSVRDSSRYDPSGQIPSKFVRGSGRYAVLATGVETTYVVAPYEVRLRSQMEPMTLTLWQYADATGAALSFQFRGTMASASRIPGWLIRTRVVPGGLATVDSAEMLLIRDGT